MPDPEHSITKELAGQFAKLFNYHTSVANWAFIYFKDGGRTFDECMDIGRRIMKGEDPNE